MQQPLMQDNMRDHWLRGQCELLRPRLLTKLRICGILVFSYAIKRQCTVGLLHYDFASFIFFFLFNFLRFSLLEARWPLWLLRSTPDRLVRVQALAGVIECCS